MYHSCQSARGPPVAGTLIGSTIRPNGTTDRETYFQASFISEQMHIQTKYCGILFVADAELAVLRGVIAETFLEMIGRIADTDTDQCLA